MAKPDKAQNLLMASWRGHTGFAFTGYDEVNGNDPEGFVRLWNRNVQWLRDMATNCEHMIEDYKRQIQK